MTANIGIAVYPGDGVDSRQVVRNARSAMRSAGNAAGSGYRFYSADMNAQATRRLDLENDLRLALDRNEFMLYYQPKVDLISGEIRGVEALLRWRNAQDEAISPAVFIPVAEDCGVIIEIGDWVLRESVAAARRLREQLGYAVAVAANVSAVQFRSERLIDTLRELVKSEPALDELLEVELTESAEPSFVTCTSAPRTGPSLALLSSWARAWDSPSSPRALRSRSRSPS